MSRYNVARPEQAHGSVMEYAAAAAVVFALMLLVMRAFIFVSVVVDGHQVSLRAGAPLSAVPREAMSAANGSIRAATNGRVVRSSGGFAPRLVRDGRLLARTDRIQPGDVLMSVRGADTTETVTNRLDPIPFTAEIKGSGSFVTMERPGSVGLREVRTGRISGDIVKDTTITAAVPMILHRTAYAKGTKLVALTFDDGPWPNTTEQILSILRTEHVPATFFVIGRQATARPALIRAIIAGGHAIGTHTQNHVYLGSASPEKTKSEIVRGDVALQRLTGKKTHWFRPPGGEMTPEVIKDTRALNLNIVLWTVDPNDWSRPGTATIVARVLQQTKPGAVILLHDGGGNRRQTVKALPKIIHELRARGYEFVTLDEISAVAP